MTPTQQTPKFVHESLAQMAWERLPPDTSLEAHMLTMANILRDQKEYEELWRRVRARMNRPVIVCLCGSTKFWRDYIERNATETKAGKIVLTVGTFVSEFAPMTTDGREIVSQHHDVTAEEKNKLDELHLQKIDLADEVLFLNRGGYMGESTRAELKYAREKRKVIRSIEPFQPGE